uniref:Uncharacterized protein n=1 Tax=Caenorhabditis tropicalis TaxID=1561998 RepID=A0A1I7T9Z6_9PELO
MNSSAVTITISTISTTTTTPITITSSSHHVIASSSKNNETCIQIAEAIAAQGIDDITVTFVVSTKSSRQLIALPQCFCLEFSGRDF